jgi:hypothetical protein
MKLPLNDLHLFVLLGLCGVTTLIAAVAAARVRAFVRAHEPELVLRFGIAPRRPFLSLQCVPDRDLGQELLFSWLHAGGVKELSQKHPHFLACWKSYRYAGLVSSVLICLWLVVGVWYLAQRGLYAA